MSGLAEELQSLSKLLDRGLITRAEFDEEKQRLMSQRREQTGSTLSFGSNIRAGQTLSGYKISAVIGKGGMGVVYRARNVDPSIATQQGGDVALKVLHSQYSQNPTYRARFEREAAVGMRLNHPTIVRVFELVHEGGNLGLVMEFVDGRELADLIGKERGPIPWREALDMFSGILDAVGYAHEHRVIHRDLKPENIMVRPNGSLKVLDFGIAKEMGSGKTKTGTGMGTIHYMAPEQYTDASKVDKRADIYALGMTLYEMLAGRLPWASSTTEFDILNKKVSGDFPAPTRFYPDIPPGLIRVLERSYAVNMTSRFSEVSAFREALNRVLSGDDEVDEVGLSEEGFIDDLRLSTISSTAESLREDDPAPRLTEAFGKCVKHRYSDFSGRASKSEYWGFNFGYFLSVILFFTCLLCAGGIESEGLMVLMLFIGCIAALILFFPSLAVLVRRFHDVGMSGWWLLLTFVPYVGSLFILVVTLLPSQGDNRYGPKPWHRV